MFPSRPMSLIKKITWLKGIPLGKGEGVLAWGFWGRRWLVKISGKHCGEESQADGRFSQLLVGSGLWASKETLLFQKS